MKKHKFHIAAIVVFIVLSIFVATYKPLQHFLPAQQVELSHGVEYGAVIKDFLFVQEITTQKRYISRVDLYMAKLPSQYSNENVFLLLDEQHRILFTKKFSSDDFGEALYFSFDFKKSFDIGKHKKVYACVYSTDGDQRSYIGLAKKENSSLGKLYVVSIMNNDIVQSFEKQQGLVNFKGSIGARTYESDTLFFSMLQIVFYVLAFCVALLLYFAASIASFIRRSRILPEYAFLGFSLVYGLVMLVITPPFMVPDEPAHFYRSYQVSEFNLFKTTDDFPKSLTDLGSICDRMQFSTHEKTTRKEILSLGNIRTNPTVRTTKTTPDYILPYLPQAIGIAAGRLMGLAPLWLFYFGRLLNLLASIALLFFAIRITPVFKWVFFLLAIMPMTLYQLASLSYDAVTIGLCFLLLATILNHALNHETKISGREIIMLFIITALLAAAKQPYVVIAFTFFIIPVKKFGSLRNYLACFAGLALSVVLMTQIGTVGKAVLGKSGSIYSAPAKITLAANPGPDLAEEEQNLKLHTAMLPMLPHSPENLNAAEEQSEPPSAGVKPVNQPQPDDATRVNPQVPVDPIDPPAQKKYILQDPVRFIGILYNTLGKSLNLYLTSFVGLFGWIDAPLPASITYAYLFFLIIFSLFGTFKASGLGLIQKGILASVFLTGFVLIETALYVYCNPVGCDAITAVQGRYFIAIGPLFFLLFLNQIYYGSWKKRVLSSSKRQGGKKLPYPSSVTASCEEILLPKSMPWIAMLIAGISLTTSLFVILERFYVISM